LPFDAGIERKKKHAGKRVSFLFFCVVDVWLLWRVLAVTMLLYCITLHVPYMLCMLFSDVEPGKTGLECYAGVALIMSWE
jgi:hypothetical protein